MSEFITKVVVAADNQTAPALNAATKGIQNYAKAATAAQSQVRGASRQSRAALQQLGYQVQDISVQLQAGQSPFVVLAQQGSQVASIFGPGGAVLGALIAVGGALAGNLVSSLTKSTEATKSLREEAEDLGYTLEELMPLTASFMEKAAKALGLEKQDETMSALDEQIERVNRLYAAIAKLEEEGTVYGDKQAAIAGLQAQLNQELADLEPLAVEAGKAAGTFAERLERAKNAADSADVSFETLNQQLEAIDAIYRSVETPAETLVRLYKEADEATRKYSLSEDIHNRMLMQALDAYKATLPKKKEDVKTTNDQAQAYENLKRSLDPAYGAYQNYYETATLINNSADTQENKITLLAVAYAKLYEALGLVEESQKKVKRRLEQTTEKVDPTPLEKYKDSIKSVDWSMEQMAANGLKSMEDGLTNFIMGTGNAADAFKSMARSIVSDLIRMQIQQSITGPLSGLLQGMSLFGGAPMTGSAGTPGVSSVGGPIAPVPSFSGGGYTGAGGRTGGLDGKGGFMAMVHPNETVVDHEKGGGAGVTVVQNINVTTGVQQTVRTEIASLMPQIAAASKQAVLDARKRGGSFGAAFGA